MSRALDLVGGLGELALIALRNGSRLRSPYWRWRYETAFGSDASRRPAFVARLRKTIEFGIWVHRIKRGR